MSLRHTLEWMLVRAMRDTLKRQSWDAARAGGERLGALVGRLGIRRRVALGNLAIAFPDLAPAAHDAILDAHYRELGRVVAEYARLGELGASRPIPAVGEVTGFEHLERAHAGGRGAILMSGHYSNFELMAAGLGQRFPVDLVVRPLKNPRVDAWVRSERERAGFGLISADRGVRGVFESLRANRFVAMLADQDARRHGVFVPFFGRPTSTAIGPARIALQRNTPIVMGFGTRRPDGRIDLSIDAPLEIERPDAEDAALRLTALHTARLEEKIRAHPAMWFWLHRRWKTSPPSEPAREAC